MNEKRLIYLVGNKCDLKNERQVTQDEAEKFAIINSLKYFEVSATLYDQTHNIFQKAVEQICNQIDENKYDLSDTVKLGKCGIRRILNDV